MAARLATAADLPPEFSAVDPAVSTYWLDHAARSISVAVLGDDTSYAHAMLTAHLLKRQNLGSSSGTGTPIQSESVGDVSVSYAVAAPAASSTGLDSTSYGQEFRRIVSLHRQSPMVI